MALTHERACELLEYNPVTGVFVWRCDHGLRCKGGARAGFKGGPGYRQIRIDGRAYFEHRIAYLLMVGEMPPASVDHINGQKQDNTWVNLRLATNSQNAANARTKAMRKSSSALKGVSRNVKLGKWQAHIKVNGKSIYLGLYDDEDQAHEAYKEAALSYFGEYGRAA